MRGALRLAALCLALSSSAAGCRCSEEKPPQITITLGGQVGAPAGDGGGRRLACARLLSPAWLGRIFGFDAHYQPSAAKAGASVACRTQGDRVVFRVWCAPGARTSFEQRLRAARASRGVRSAGRGRYSVVSPRGLLVDLGTCAYELGGGDLRARPHLLPRIADELERALR